MTGRIVAIVRFMAIVMGSISVTASASATGAQPAQEAASPAPQWSTAMAYDAARQMVVLFSHDGGGQTWAWSGHRWALLHPRHSPTPRRQARMAYDAARKRVVLFGGSHFTRTGRGAFRFGDTWTWDGTDWHQQLPPSSPSPRFGTAMTYDPDRRAVILFGGYGRPNEFFYDTWAWDGRSWTQLSATTPPSFFGNVDAMAFDPQRRRVMFFAFAGGPPSQQAMWFFDGMTWTREQLPPSQLPLNGQGMVYDQVVGRMVEFGGSGGTEPSPVRSVRSDLWAWDGRAWSPLRTGRTPPPRAYLSMVYDADRAELVVFGGLDGADRPLRDTWTWNGSTWSLH